MKLKANWVHQMALYEVEGQAWYSEDGLEWFLTDGTSVVDCLFYSSEIHLNGGPEDGEVVGLDLDELYADSDWFLHSTSGEHVLIQFATKGHVTAYRWALSDNGQWIMGHPCMHLEDAVYAANYFMKASGEKE